VTFRGLTGLVAFDQAGIRTGVSLDVMSVTNDGIEKVKLNELNENMF